jgi:hypothetical protein
MLTPFINRRTARGIAVLLLCWALPLECAAAPKELRTTWRELAGIAAGKKISIVLPEGAHLRGNVLAVESDKLILDVTKTSDNGAFPKGRISLPRASLRSFTMTQSRTFWKVIGTAIGLGGGLAIAAPVNTYAHNEGDGAPLAVATIIAVPTALGFLAGWSADRKKVTVTITD